MRDRLFERLDQTVLYLDFMYDLEFLFDHLNRLYWKGLLPKYRIEWSNRMIVTWGCCYRTRKLIRISTFFRRRPLPELIALLKHEMIHIRIPGHGHRFRQELRRVGIPCDVEGMFPHLDDLTNQRRRSYRYNYECPRCKVRIRRRIKIHGYCVACHDSGVTSRFKLMN